MNENNVEKKNSYTKFSEAAVGTSIERPVVVSTVKDAEGKGGTYVKLTLMDGSSVIQANMWKTSTAELEQKGITEGCIADVLIDVQEFNGKSYIVKKIAPTKESDVTIDDFIKTPPIPSSVMFDEMIALLESASNDYNGKYEPLSKLAISILTSEKIEDRFKTSSAAISMHHNMKSGLIYHSYRMMKLADVICTVYPDLDRELLLCSAALHDIGKVWEYATNLYGEAEFTSAGVLFGHLYLGASLIKQYSAKSNYNPEKVMLLTHMILSHHGTQEYGAVKTPAFAEAYVLHYIDNIDAKIGTCENYYETLMPGETTEKTPFGLTNRIYKPRL